MSIKCIFIVPYTAKRAIIGSKAFHWEEYLSGCYRTGYDKTDFFTCSSEKQLTQEDLESILQWSPKPCVLFVKTEDVEHMKWLLKLLRWIKDIKEPQKALPNLKDVEQDMNNTYPDSDVQFNDESIIGRQFMGSIDTSDKNNPLQKRMDEITHEPNEIDAVFVANLKLEFVVAKSELSNDPNRRVDAEKMNACLIGLKELPMIRDLGKGELDFVVFQLKGGIVCLSKVPNREDLWLGFISATHQGMPRLLSFRDQYLDELNQLANQHN